MGGHGWTYQLGVPKAQNNRVKKQIQNIVAHLRTFHLLAHLIAERCLLVVYITQLLYTMGGHGWTGLWGFPIAQTTGLASTSRIRQHFCAHYICQRAKQSNDADQQYTIHSCYKQWVDNGGKPIGHSNSSKQQGQQARSEDDSIFAQILFFSALNSKSLLKSSILYKVAIYNGWTWVDGPSGLSNSSKRPGQQAHSEYGSTLAPTFFVSAINSTMLLISSILYTVAIYNGWTWVDGHLGFPIAQNSWDSKHIQNTVAHLRTFDLLVR